MFSEEVIPYPTRCYFPRLQTAVKTSTALTHSLVTVGVFGSSGGLREQACPFAHPIRHPTHSAATNNRAMAREPTSRPRYLLAARVGLDSDTANSDDRCLSLSFFKLSSFWSHWCPRMPPNGLDTSSMESPSLRSSSKSLLKATKVTTKLLNMDDQL